MNAPAPAPSPAEPPWASARDEELLAMRICDLGVRLAGSELEPRIAQLHAGAGGARHCAPARVLPRRRVVHAVGQTLIAIPFYLAHPRLKALELRQMLEVEGGTPEWCLQLFRHECGHAIDHAYRFSRRRRWSSCSATPTTMRPPTSIARGPTRRASCATCRTGTRRRTPTRTSPRPSPCGWARPRASGARATAAGRRSRSSSTSTS